MLRELFDEDGTPLIPLKTKRAHYISGHIWCNEKAEIDIQFHRRGRKFLKIKSRAVYDECNGKNMSREWRIK